MWHRRFTCLHAGSVRCSEAVDKLQGEYDIVVNIQGDEPLMEPSVIDDVVAALQASPEVGFRSACPPAYLQHYAGLAQLCMIQAV